MSAFQLNTTEQMLFALLRASLHQKEVELSYFQSANDTDWKNCYQLAIEQGVMALAWDGVMKLPRELQPAKALKLNWYMAVEAYEQKYLHYCRTVDELSRLYAEHGIVTMQLKGVGFSVNYPIPSHREGGDIDIYTYAAEGCGMTDAQANVLADRLMIEQGIKVDDCHSFMHTAFFYKGVPIENHHRLLDVYRYKAGRQVAGWLLKHVDPRWTELAEGRVLTPSPEFNTVYLAFHTFHHYGNGLKLHHLCDWAIQMKQYGLSLPNEITDKYFLNGIAALTCLTNEYLGTSVSVSGGEELSQAMLQEILRPKYAEVVPANTKWGILLYKVRRLFHRYRLSSSVLRGSLIWYLGFIFTYHLRYPETNFRKQQR